MLLEASYANYQSSFESWFSTSFPVEGSFQVNICPAIGFAWTLRAAKLWLRWITSFSSETEKEQHRAKTWYSRMEAQWWMKDTVVKECWITQWPLQLQWLQCQSAENSILRRWFSHSEEEQFVVDIPELTTLNFSRKCPENGLLEASTVLGIQSSKYFWSSKSS